MSLVNVFSCIAESVNLNEYVCSVFVGGFPEYTKELIDHLVDEKLKHWARYLLYMYIRVYY